ncbi:uncharacterized protein [Leptinotarsa decemlineata]|uniref:uncharacterized protein n=1 Tax=Leptinotarsa decemlineata TaxID=7539 RepID=UPI003D3064BE
MKDLADFILVHQALAKLDSETVKSFEMSVRGKGIPAYEDVIKFVKQQAKILNLNRNATTGRPLAGVQHDQGVHGAVPSEVNASSDASNTNTTSENFCGTAIKNRNNTVLLSTVVVNVLNGSGQGQTARFLLDSGSQVHLITQKCSKKLGLKISRCSVSVQGIGSNTYSVRGITDLIVASRYDSSKKYFMQALLVDKISDRLPRVKIERSFLGSFGDIQLADNKFDEPTEIDGIIGAELFATVIGNKSYAPSAGSPVAVQTVFGYVIMGKVPILNSVSDSRVFFNLKEESSLNELMTKFWEIEQVPKNILPDAEELECDKMYTSTFNRDSEGRFTVALPFKNSPSTLSDSKTGAMTRLYSLERRLTKFPELRSGYNDIMRESIEQGHMHWVKDEYLKAADTTYYIPHHAIFKPDSSSTPIRIVLDASASSDSDISLNDILYGGPKLQTDIFSLLLNFRLFRIAVTADIRRMYHQIKLVNYHWRFQRLLWRFSPDEPVQVYEFNRLAFGVKTSPYLALRTVKQLIKEEGYKYPLAAEVVSTDLYMDDLVCSVSSEEEAQRLYSESVAMFAEGKFDLTKWSSSSLELLEKIPFEKRLSQPVLFKTETKILGMFWNPEMDSFRFKFPVPGSSCTKRLILSTVARCYDPVGLVAPFVLYLKLLIKELWKLKIGWDDIVPYEVVESER